MRSKKGATRDCSHGVSWQSQLKSHTRDDHAVRQCDVDVVVTRLVRSGPGSESWGKVPAPLRGLIGVILSHFLVSRKIFNSVRMLGHNL